MKTRNIRICLFFLLFAFSSTSFSQEVNYQAKYLNGKELFRAGNFELAMEAFRPVTKQDPKNPFTAFASYYFALSAFNAGQEDVAENMFLQILQKHSDWNQLDEVRFWLAKIRFERGEFSRAFLLLDEIKNPQLKSEAVNMKLHYIEPIQDLEALKKLAEKKNMEPEVVEMIADKLLNKIYSKDSQELLKDFVKKYNLTADKYKQENISKYKKDYKVAVLLPLMLKDLSIDKVARSSNFVLDLYAGMLHGIEEIKKDSIPVKFYVYDYKRDSLETVKILAKEEMKSMDLIIGPLYPVPSKLASDFSKENKINMINPLSFNSNVIGDNPYSFLFKASTETQVRQAAEFAINHFKDEKDVLIISGSSPKDILMAVIYKNAIEKAGFNVVKYVKVDNDAKRAVDFLKETFENGDKKGQLVIPTGTYDHIFVASSNELVVANTISAVETRRDNIPIIGQEDWLDSKILSYDQLAKLNIYLISPNYIDGGNPKYVKFKESFMSRMKMVPNSNTYTGYELSKFVVKVLLEHGANFHNGLHRSTYFPAEIYSGFNYFNANDNQHVPVIKIEGSKFKVVNKGPMISLDVE
jgi:ABC-type branched-subunit amino acid transport system substrate-binding protein